MCCFLLRYYDYLYVIIFVNEYYDIQEQPHYTNGLLSWIYSFSIGPLYFLKVQFLRFAHN